MLKVTETKQTRKKILLCIYNSYAFDININPYAMPKAPSARF